MAAIDLAKKTAAMKIHKDMFLRLTKRSRKATNGS